MSSPHWLSCRAIPACSSCGGSSRPRRATQREHSSISTVPSPRCPMTVRVPRALALMALGRDEAAVRDWSLALDDDPEDPRLISDGPGP